MKTIKLLFASALLAGVFTTGMIVNDVTKVEAAETKRVVYNVTGRNQISVESGTQAISGTNANFVNTYTGSNFDQITKNNSITFSLTNIPSSVSLTKLSLNLHTNKSSGNGTISVNVGDTVVINENYPLGYSTTYQYYDYEIENLTGDLEVVISCSSNSLYCNSFAIEYVDNQKFFDVNYYLGDSIINTQKVAEGSTITRPSMDTDTYYVKEFYSNPELTDVFNFENPINGDTNIYLDVHNYTKAEFFTKEKTKTSLVANYYTNDAVGSKYLAKYQGTDDVEYEENIEYQNYLPGMEIDWTITGTNVTYGPRLWGSDNTIRLYAGETMTFKHNFMNVCSVKFDIDTGATKLQISEDGTIYSDVKNNTLLKLSGNSREFTIKAAEKCFISSIEIEVGDPVVYTPTSASLRFGTSLEKDKYYDETAKYGVIITDTVSLNKTTLKAYKEQSSALTATEFKDELVAKQVKANSIDMTSTLAFVDKPFATEESETGTYFQFALVLDGLLENNLDTKFTATCYMETADGLFLMNEVEWSVRSLCNDYYHNSQDYGFTTEQKEVLNSIINYGKAE